MRTKPERVWGRKWEGAVITQELYDAEADNRKFIPVVFSSEDLSRIPIVLRGVTHYQVDTERGYKDLYRHLTNQPRVRKPDLGTPHSMPPMERKQDFYKPWNVPHPRNPFFTGRKEILMQLQAALTSGGTAALAQPQAISGLGGIGKTQTAVEYAYRHQDEYQAVLWVRADAREALVSGFVALADLLNLPEKDSQDQNLAIAAAKRWLDTNHHWLLVLDNADNPRLVDDFLPLTPRGHILLTSRAQVFDNLGITKPIELDDMTLDEAVEFLLRRTGRDEVDEAETEGAKQLAEELGYLPLALEQAGAYITKNRSSFRDYLASYRRRGLELLQRARAVTGKYPESLATTWSLNFEQVAQTSTAAADLLQFSAFLNPDKIPLELIGLGAEELGPALSTALANFEGDPLVLDEVLEPLTQYSLIRRDLESRAYDIHRLVQAVLVEGLDEVVRRQWAERTVRAVGRAFPNVDFEAWPLCERLLQHAQACFHRVEQWGLEFVEAGGLLNGAGLYLSERARYSEAEPLYQRALVIAEKALGPDHPDVATLLENYATLLRRVKRPAEAVRMESRAKTIRAKHSR